MSPTSSAEKTWFSAAKNETKSSGFWAKIPAKNVPISTVTLPLVVLDIFHRKNGLFFQQKIQRRSVLRLGSEGGATENC